MEYNTARKKLKLPEYGRHVHNMVLHAMQIEDREQRNVAAQTIIGVMGSLVPSLRDAPDFKHKLWDHLQIISDFKLDIDTPYPSPSFSELVERPHNVPYPQTSVRVKHYGKILINMIRETGKLADCEHRDALIQLLAAQMKKSYTAWNRNEINNEQIIQDIWDISDGAIQIRPDMILFPVEPVKRENTIRQPMPSYGGGGGFMSKKKRKLMGRK